MARRPDLDEKEKIWSREDLKEIMRNLAVLSEHGVREFYQRAYRECAIINSHTLPPARAVQELVQVWKQLRKWWRPYAKAKQAIPSPRSVSVNACGC